MPTFGAVIDMLTNRIVNVGNPTAPQDAATKSYVDSATAGGGGAGVPVGSVTMYSGAVAPTGWLLCDGSTFANATYPALATLLGDAFGVHSGTSYFLPDLRGRFPLGASPGQTKGNIGDNEGATTAPGVGDPTRLDHRHNHDGTSLSGGSSGSAHSHSIAGQAADPNPLLRGTGTAGPVSNGAYGGHAHGGDTGQGTAHTHNITGTTGTAGVGGVANPSAIAYHAMLTLNFIIRAT